MGGEKPNEEKKEQEEQEEEKVKDPIIERNLAIARAAEEEARRKKEAIPLLERVEKTAKLANRSGGAVGLGLRGLGAQIAAAVNKVGEGGKLSVSKVVEEEEKGEKEKEKLSKEQADKEV